jgi:hypothetical protein
MASRELVEKLRRELLPERPQPKVDHQAEKRAHQVWLDRQRGMDTIYRQQAIDAVWERTQRVKAEREAEAEHWSYHRCPGDPDWSR